MHGDSSTADQVRARLSILGSMNGLVLTGPRVYYAMARDGVFPPILGQISGHYRTPGLALIVQGVWSAGLAVSGSYQRLFTDVIFTAWIFCGLAVAAFLVLRRAQPHLERPFRVPAYPWLSLLFCTAAIGLVLSAFTKRPGSARIGIGLVATDLSGSAASEGRLSCARRATTRSRERRKWIRRCATR